MFAPGPVVQQFVQSGQLKALGVTDTQRSKFYPDVPTVADAVPGYEAVGWFGLLAPPSTPPAIVKQINEVIVAAMQTQGFRDHLATLRADLVADAGRVRPLHQCRCCQMEQARERQRRAIAGRKVNASCYLYRRNVELRFGVVRGERVFDVVALAGALGKPGPADQRQKRRAEQYGNEPGEACKTT